MENPVNATELSFEIQRSEETRSVPTKTHKDNYTNITTSPYVIQNLPPDSSQFFIVIVTGKDINDNKVSIIRQHRSNEIVLRHTQGSSEACECHGISYLETSALNTLQLKTNPKTGNSHVHL